MCPLDQRSSSQNATARTGRASHSATERTSAPRSVSSAMANVARPPGNVSIMEMAAAGSSSRCAGRAGTSTRYRWRSTASLAADSRSFPVRPSCGTTGPSSPASTRGSVGRHETLCDGMAGAGRHSWQSASCHRSGVVTHGASHRLHGARDRDIELLLFDKMQQQVQRAVKIRNAYAQRVFVLVRL